ncbi:hypothetical protein Sps_02703 [Shewanella psychrophila]|uniref:Uncharacterized protein n=1 Tax=Shewanella psychrophila TaxID=225848 RepID=A0A1S6HQP5_9GAMM|nr:hypothetical protein [Shewanella psychrophila]AQS37855.1 hypothetical protein Sps_02703 [Shewanella psychrophila]
MKKAALIASTILCASTLFAGVATAGDWWRTVSATASISGGSGQGQVCGLAENKLRAQYSDVTAIKTYFGFDTYTLTSHCRATGQTQQ